MPGDDSAQTSSYDRGPALLSPWPGPPILRCGRHGMTGSSGVFYAINGICDYFSSGLGPFEAGGKGGLAGFEIFIHIEEMLDLIE